MAQEKKDMKRQFEERHKRHGPFNCDSSRDRRHMPESLRTRIATIQRGKWMNERD